MGLKFGQTDGIVSAIWFLCGEREPKKRSKQSKIASKVLKWIKQKTMFFVSSQLAPCKFYNKYFTYFKYTNLNERKWNCEKIKYTFLVTIIMKNTMKTIVCTNLHVEPNSILTLSFTIQVFTCAIFFKI